MESKDHKSGFVSIIGNPNVGKSTLMNALVGKELSIITHKAQTTRHRILGIVNGEDFQMVLSDTPGVIKPAYEMQACMMNFVKEALIDADVLIYMVTPEEKELKEEQFFEKIKKNKAPLYILINKIDQISQETLEKAVSHWETQFPKAKVLPISALTGFYIPELLQILISELPTSPAYFPKDQLTDKPERFFVNEAIREQILAHYSKEIPYAVEVIHYNVEKDPGKHLEYHSHFVIEGACLGQLKKESQRVLKTSNWIRDYSVDSTFYSHVEVLKSVYGEVRIHACPNISGFLDYMSGNTKQKTVGYYYYLPKALKEKIDKELPV